MSNLTILNTSIHQNGSLYSLNDLHRVSGSEDKHRPAFFIRLDTTQDLVAEIQKDSPAIIPIKTLRGAQGGTFACEEIALAYAMWISPKFHLIVLRAFLAMHKQQYQPQQPALPEPEKKFTFEFTEHELQQLAWDWFALFQGVEFVSFLIPALDSIQSKFAPQAHSIVSEYGSMLRRHQPLLQKLTAEFKTGTWEDQNWNRVLPTIRDNDLLRPKHRLIRR